MQMSWKGMAAEHGEEIEAAFFLIMFVYAVWQDLRFKSLGKGFLAAAGAIGIFLAAWQSRLGIKTVYSVFIGIFLLFMNRITGGGVGEGDGWFFIATGFYLKPEENFMLLLSGLVFCSIYGLASLPLLQARKSSGRKIQIPFLPFLLPAGLWLTLF